MLHKQPHSLDLDQHHHLLRAIFCRGATAESAWQAWRAELDWDNIEFAAKQLVPLLYESLIRLNIQDPLLGRFKGMYRRTWYQNTLLLHQAESLLRNWQHQGITVICLMDIPLACNYYTKLGLRPIHLKFLVNKDDVNSAIECLRHEEWLPRNGHLPDRFIDTSRSHRFTKASQGQLSLHWRLYPQKRLADYDDFVWEGKLPIQLNGITTYAPNPADLLLYLCVPDSKWQASLPLRVADILTLLNHAKNDIDWARLCTQSQNYHLADRVGRTLQHLSDRYDASIPDPVLETLRLNS